MKQRRFPYTVSLFSLFINSITEAMIRTAQPSLDTSRTLKAKTSVHHRSRDITLKHSQGFCNPSRPNSLRKKIKEPKNSTSDWNKCRRVGRVSHRLCKFRRGWREPGDPNRARWMTSWWEGHSGGVGVGGMLLRETLSGDLRSIRWRSRRRFIWSRAEAALRWESDSPWIYYPTNPESGTLRKSSTADCCCLDRFAVASDVRALLFFFFLVIPSRTLQLKSQLSFHLSSPYSATSFSPLTAPPHLLWGHE